MTILCQDFLIRCQKNVFVFSIILFKKSHNMYKIMACQKNGTVFVIIQYYSILTYFVTFLVTWYILW
nr:MAG TPA_asm: hypothetical protein [Bacteriophage sp.]